MADATDRLMRAADERLREFGITLHREPHDAEGRAANVDARIDAVVTLSHAEARARYAVVAKDSMTLSALAKGTFPPLPYPLLIVGNRISRRSAAAFRDAGVQFIDALGNAFLAFGSVRIEVQGRTEATAPDSTSINPIVPPRRPANIFSPRRSQVILALLTWPELSAAKVRDIARAAGVSVGQAHDALTQLDQAGFLVPSSPGLVRADELLDYWTAAYPTGLGKRLEVARYHGDPLRPISRPDPDQPLYLSGESAEGTDIARPATLTLYIDVLDRKLPLANRWSSSPDHTPNILVRQKFWTSPRPDEEPLPTKGRNAPWPLVYADLVATGDARLREVARTWRARCARPDKV